MVGSIVDNQTPIGEDMEGVTFYHWFTTRLKGRDSTATMPYEVCRGRHAEFKVELLLSCWQAGVTGTSLRKLTGQAYKSGAKQTISQYLEKIYQGKSGLSLFKALMREAHSIATANINKRPPSIYERWESEERAVVIPDRNIFFTRQLIASLEISQTRYETLDQLLYDTFYSEQKGIGQELDAFLTSYKVHGGQSGEEFLKKLRISRDEKAAVRQILESAWFFVSEE